jgi:hypothetical protein
MGSDSLCALHVGINVSGDVLDVCTSSGEFWRGENDAMGANPKGYSRGGAPFDSVTLMRIARAISPPHRGPLIHVY